MGIHHLQGCLRLLSGGLCVGVLQRAVRPHDEYSPPLSVSGLDSPASLLLLVITHVLIRLETFQTRQFWSVRLNVHQARSLVT